MQYTLSLNPAPAALMNAVLHALRRGEWMSPTPAAANHESGFDDATYTAQSSFSLSKNQRLPNHSTPPAGLVRPLVKIGNNAVVSQICPRPLKI